MSVEIVARLHKIKGSQLNFLHCVCCVFNILKQKLQKVKSLLKISPIEGPFTRFVNLFLFFIMNNSMLLFEKEMFSSQGSALTFSDEFNENLASAALA